jgi:hypothetical protein
MQCDSLEDATALALADHSLAQYYARAAVREY